MNLGSTPAMGRYVVDINGCLRATDHPSLSPQDVIALHGGLHSDASVVLEIYDETRALGSADRVTLSEDTVAFFRTVEAPLWARGASPSRAGAHAPMALAA